MVAWGWCPRAHSFPSTLWHDSLWTRQKMGKVQERSQPQHGTDNGCHKVHWLVNQSTLCGGHLVHISFFWHSSVLLMNAEHHRMWLAHFSTCSPQHTSRAVSGIGPITNTYWCVSSLTLEVPSCAGQGQWAIQSRFFHASAVSLQVHLRWWGWTGVKSEVLGGVKCERGSGSEVWWARRWKCDWSDDIQGPTPIMCSHYNVRTCDCMRQESAASCKTQPFNYPIPASTPPSADTSDMSRWCAAVCHRLTTGMSTKIVTKLLPLQGACQREAWEWHHGCHDKHLISVY